MKQNTKDWMQHTTAVVLIASAIAMGFLSFFTTEDIGTMDTSKVIAFPYASWTCGRIFYQQGLALFNHPLTEDEVARVRQIMAR